MLPMRLFFVVVAICISVASNEPTGPLKNNHEVLGITRAATFEDIQNAFQKLSKMYQDRRKEGEPPVPALVEIQHAYEAISNKDMQADALRFVDYWGYVSQLEDDMALRRFLEFQPSGSSRLRMAVVVRSNSLEEDDTQHFEVYATAVKFGHRVRVGQISQTDALAPDGQPSEFIKSLKLHRTPAVVLMDPITRIHKVRYILDGISGEVERILNGELGNDDKLGWLQEFDADAYKSKCQDAEDPTVSCSSIFLFATSPELEQRREDLVAAAKPFNDACRKIGEDKGGEVACFWLRRGRAEEWDSVLQQKFQGVTGEALAVAVKKGSPDQISMAPQDIVGSTERITAWFDEVLDSKASMQALVPWPALPRTLRVTDEPEEDQYSKIFRKALFIIGCLQNSECRANQKYEDEFFLRLHILLQQYGLYEYYVQLLGPGTDWTVVAGVAVLVLFFLFVLCKRCCCGSRRATRTEQEAAESAEFLFSVTLTKSQEGEKLGMNLTTVAAGGVRVDTIDENGLVSRLNAKETRPERQIRLGDRIVCVTGDVGGTKTSAREKDKMLPILKSMQSTLTLSRHVYSNKHPSTLRIIGTCHLEGIPLHGNVELGLADGGGPLDFEIKSLGPALVQWNELKNQQGACCTQQLQVGDRIISVGGSTNVLVPPPVAQPQQPQKALPVLFVRWRAANSIKARTIEVNIEKDDGARLGMEIRTRQYEPKQLEILDVVADGTMALKWNNDQRNEPIRRGDRIASVGGKTDKESISAGLAEKRISMCFERWVETSAGAIDASPVAPMPGELARMSTMDYLKENHAQQATPPLASMPAPTPTPSPPSVPSFQPTPQAVSSPPPPIPQPTKAPSSSRSVTSGAAPAPIRGNAFPWMSVLVSMVIATVVVLGGLRGGAPGSDAKTRIPAEAQVYLKQINPELYPEVAALLLLLGLLMAANFMRNEYLENYSPGLGAGVLQQLCGAAVASTFLGFGSFFLLAWSGVYVLA
mmetsp:Transcript_36349/g.58217  ORF Transcript_36349/g.58217 Transcript_36349/m.58217 type:complete len:988 (+) Transcript_36349:98-3061(+)